MTPIVISAPGHATVRLEAGEAVIVVDPGVLAPDSAFTQVDAFLVTHDHEDHVDVERLAGALAATPGSRAWAPSTVVERLRAAGAAGEQVEAVDRDTRFEAAGVAVRAIAGTHAAIHPAVPDLTNVAYLVADRLLHPGDAFPAVPDAPALEVMFLPVSGPWMRFADAADYVAALHPGIVVPIHDGDLNDVGRTLTDQLSGLLGDVRYERLSDGRTLTV
ncbi:MBL fold metallo-hydrolase [Nocardia thailandica]|uniref:MBL fold metallo-hydrolase n=1 Tax=Nocardia thailandica TaxID=257275 RepID=UPI0002F3171C|nr:MBL fold metallo-hydrolase [Nocardia thailandica]